MIRTAALLALALTACDRAERVAVPTAAETERLNDAETMLDATANQSARARP